MRKAWLCLGFLTMAACDDQPLSTGQSLGGSGNSVTMSSGAPSGAAGSGAAGSVTTVDTGNGGAAAPQGAGGSGAAGPVCEALPASSQCAPNPTGAVVVASRDDLVTAMVGRWLLCGHESAFAVDGGDVGIEITADGHWYKLFTAQGGTTIRGAGFDEEGTWTEEDLTDHFQVNFDIFGSGTVITAPVFASTPRAMRLDNNGVYVGNYVIDPSVGVGTVRCAARP
jgi:hypothetical protein